MKHIDEARIGSLLSRARTAGPAALDAVIEKTRSLRRLTLEETAVLLATEDPAGVRRICDAAAEVKDRIYGKRVVLFAPLYVSNVCSNRCLYCAFNADNPSISRKALSTDEIREQVAWLLSRGHRRVLLVAGESGAHGMPPVDYYVEAVKAIYSVQVGRDRIKRVNINCAPLSVEDFRRLKASGIGTYQLFQETYHEETYRKVHVAGPKADPDNRIDAVDRAFRAGIDDVGIGVLYGLCDYRFETLGLMMHIEHLEREFNVGPHTVSVPRIEPAEGSDFSRNVPHPLSDEEFKKLVAVIRLSVPYTGIILSTRETPAMRDELLNYGVSQISAGSRTAPGGYDGEEDRNGQFSLNDHRTLDEMVATLIEQGFIPSFCAACYRKERTGETFMNLARPGTIKGKCSINGLITLKEYLDDYASDAVKRAGYRLLNDMKAQLDDESREQLTRFFEEVDRGLRDRYI